MDFLNFLLLFSAGSFVIGFIFGMLLKGSGLGAAIFCGALFLILMGVAIPWDIGVIETLALWRHEDPGGTLIWFSVYAFYSGGFTLSSFVGYFLGGKARNACQRRRHPRAEPDGDANGIKSRC